MNIQGKLDLIEEILDKATGIPFSSKMAVDVEAIRTHVGDIRLELPVEIKKAQDIVEHHNSILKKASTEASVATSTAQKQADEIVGAAKEHAKGIIDNADANASSKIAAATEQARRMVEASEVARLAQEYSDKVRSQATGDAEEIIKNAKAQAEAIVQDATNKAEAIKRSVDEWSENMRVATNRYVSDIMKNSDGVLSANIAEIRKARQSLQASIEKR